jgi:hypothetical protein
MKRIIAIAALIAGVGSATLLGAQQKAGVIVADSVETIVTVVEVDREARTVTVRGEKGHMATINVPEQAQNLDQVRPGSRFKVQYVTSVALSLRKGSGIASSNQGSTVEVAAKGDTPGGSVVTVHQVNAVVEGLDRDNRSVTLRGPEGGPFDLQVGEEVKAYGDIEVGDTVAVEYTEGLAMRMIQQ